MRKYKLIFAGDNTAISLTCAPMKSKLIVALDVDGFERAAGLVTQLRNDVEIFKVGSQLFTRTGPRIVEFINSQSRQCFLDLKFHDIPDTVAKAVKSAASLGVAMLTVHVAGGEKMLRSAAMVHPRPKLLGVTVLTSVAGDVEAEVLERAMLAQKCGLDGVIASPHEIRQLRKELGGNFLIVTPGIRPAGSEAGDQKRTLTPAQAAWAGADYIVVGRPIIEAGNPLDATRRILAELA